MRWCARCVMPDSRPDLTIGPDGVCAACVSTARKRDTDWALRTTEFKSLVGRAKDEAARRGTTHDTIAAVSGGKDSAWIVRAATQAGLRVLGVSFEPTSMTAIGQRNLDNLQRFCDVVQVKKNREVYRHMRQIGLRDVGDAEWPGHAGIFSSVLQEAVLRRVPLVLWGEDPPAEYGPPDTHRQDGALDAAWVAEYGGLLGLRPSDCVDLHGFDPRDIALYAPPSANTMRAAGVESRFLGHYMPWDTIAQAKLVRDEMGFRWASGPPYTGAFWPFENLDDSVAVAFHDFLALLKYGYTRAAAQLSIEIRHGYRTRADALAIVREIGDCYPEAEEAAFCAAIGMSQDEVRAICTSHANPAIWAEVALPVRLVRRPDKEVR